MQQVLKNQSFYFTSTNKIQIQLSVINRDHSTLGSAFYSLYDDEEELRDRTESLIFIWNA